MTRRAAAVTVAIAVTALVASVAALVVVLTRPSPGPVFPLVCGESFTDAQTGRTAPMYVACSTTRPVP